jgi:hypothetical protein
MPAFSLVALVLLVLLMFLILLLALDLVLEHIRTNGTRGARGEGTEYAAAELVGAPGTGCAAYQCRPETSLTVGADGTSWASSGARGTVVVLGMAVGVMVLGLLVLAIARLLLVVLRLLLVMLLLLLLMRGSTVVGGLLRMRGVAACVGGLLGVLLVLRLLGVLILQRS